MIHPGGVSPLLPANSNMMPIESPTEKLLMSNDKVTVKDLWAGDPVSDFP